MNAKPSSRPVPPVLLRRWAATAVWLCAAGVAPVQAQPSPAAVEALEAYLDFVDYGGGVMLAQQLTREDWPRYLFIDARDAGQYAREHIPGAIHIEWRRVLAERNRIPRDRPVLLYCNTGSLSAQAALALRVAGWDNVRVLQGGLEAWKAAGRPGLSDTPRPAPLPQQH